jgi:hypothetical protein
MHSLHSSKHCPVDQQSSGVQFHAAGQPSQQHNRAAVAAGAEVWRSGPVRLRHHQQPAGADQKQHVTCTRRCVASEPAAVLANWFTVRAHGTQAIADMLCWAHVACWHILTLIAGIAPHSGTIQKVNNQMWL